MFEYDKESMNAAKALDRYDLLGVLSSCYTSGRRDPSDIQEEITRRFVELKTIIEDLTLDEFMEYLSNRYNIWFEEVISYRLSYVQNKKSEVI